jgi:ATP-dependent Zn protease
VGSGAKKVREYFEMARENRPVIIFIDELESIGFHRSSDSQSYQMNIERYSTLNQLLAEMDGVVDNKNLVIMAATNREDLLDAALVRPGRFDYKINLTPPDAKLRIELFKLYLEKYKYDKQSISENSLEFFAKVSQGLTGANIESIVNEAATASYSKDKTEITLEELQIAFTKGFEEFERFKNYEMKNIQSN